MSPRGESGPNSEPPTVIHRLPRAAKELVAGGIAGGLAKTSIAPLERVKILFQTGKARDVSVAEALVNIFKAEGVAGLFKGNSASLLRIVPYSAFHFGAYEQFRRGLTAVACSPSSPTIPPVLDLLAGSAAGATAVAFTYPLDVARARIAYSTEAPSPPVAAAPGGGRQHGRHALSVLRVLRMSLQQEGVVGLYRGLGPTMWGILPYAGLKFYVYQSLKQTFQRAYPGASAAGSTDGKPATEGRRQRLPVLVMLTFGAVAGLVAQTVTYPLDVVRRRMQVQDFCAPGAPAAALPASWQPRRAPPLLHMPALAVASTAAAAQARVPAPVLCQAAGLPLAQPQPGLPAARIRSTWHGLRLIAAESGLRGLFAGLSITYMKVIPATAIGFTMYDMLKTAMGLSHNF